MELIAPEKVEVMKVKSYNATFVKNTGEERVMNFVRNSDLPSKFLNGTEPTGFKLVIGFIAVLIQVLATMFH